MRDPMLVEKPGLYPAMCVDGSQDGPVVDTGYELKWHGRVYLSMRMLRSAMQACPRLLDELALEAGYVPAKVHETMLRSRDDQLEAAERDIKAFEKLSLDAVRRAAHEIPDAPAPEPAPKPAARPAKRRPAAGRSS